MGERAVRQVDRLWAYLMSTFWDLMKIHQRFIHTRCLGVIRIFFINHDDGGSRLHWRQHLHGVT